MPVTTPVGDTIADRPLTRAVLIGLTDAVGVRPGPDAALEPVATLERPGRRCDIYRHPATRERYVAVLRTSAAPGPRVLADGGYKCCRASARAHIAAPHRPAVQRTAATRVRVLLRAISARGRRRRHLRSPPHEGGPPAMTDRAHPTEHPAPRRPTTRDAS